MTTNYKYDGRLYRPRCSHCGVYLSYGCDSYTPYGCKDYDSPEPLDEIYLCGKHSKESYFKFLKKFQEGYRYGDWMKSSAEMKAADKAGLVWVGSSGIGTLGTNDFAEPHRYIEKKEYERLSKLPYWGYCKICNAENKNGYCSNDNCSSSYKNKILSKLT